MTPTKTNCRSCDKPLINEHGIKTKFLRINGNGTTDAKCKNCGEFNPVPIIYSLPKTPA